MDGQRGVSEGQDGRKTCESARLVVGLLLPTYTRVSDEVRKRAAYTITIPFNTVQTVEHEDILSFVDWMLRRICLGSMVEGEKVGFRSYQIEFV